MLKSSQLENDFFSLAAGGAITVETLQFPPDRETELRRKFGEDTLSPHRCRLLLLLRRLRVEDANSLPETPAVGQISILDFPSPLWKV